MFLASGFAPLIFIIHLEPRITAQSKSVDLVKIKDKFLDWDIDEFRKLASAVERKTKESPKKIEDEEVENLKSKSREILNQYEVLLKEYAVAVDDKEGISTLLRFSIYFEVAGGICMIIGAGLMGFGFTLWYKKLQKYQDDIIRKKASK